MGTGGYLECMAVFWGLGFVFSSDVEKWMIEARGTICWIGSVVLSQRGVVTCVCVCVFSLLCEGHDTEDT